MLINSLKGAEAYSICYSLAESAKAKSAEVYDCFRHLLPEMLYRIDNNGYIDSGHLEDNMPWTEERPDVCRKHH